MPFPTSEASVPRGRSATFAWYNPWSGGKRNNRGIRHLLIQVVLLLNDDQSARNAQIVYPVPDLDLVTIRAVAGGRRLDFDHCEVLFIPVGNIEQPADLFSCGLGRRLLDALFQLRELLFEL